MKLGLDLGNSTNKIVGEIEGEQKFKQVQALATADSQDKLNVVDIDGEIIHFGVGYPLYETDKTKRKYLAHQILLAAYKIYGPGPHEIKLGLTLPITLYKLAGEAYKKQVEALGEIKGVVNGIKVSVKLEKVNVKPEGLSAFYALQPQIKKQPTLLMDMGGGTTDILVLNVAEGKWQLENTIQINKGGIELLEKISKSIYNVTGEMFTAQQLERRLLEGDTIGHVAISDHFEAASDIVDEINREIHTKCNDMAYRNIICIGGGAFIYNKIAGLNNLQVITDDKQLIYSNAMGSFLQL